MANINELTIPDDKISVDYSNIPEEYGERVPVPQPGPYLFQLPNNLSNVWDVIERPVGKRIQAEFHGDSALTIHLADNNTRTFSAWITNAEFPHGKEKFMVSDMHYLVRALDQDAKPTTNKEFVDELSKHGGKQFKATVTWSAYCNINKDAYFFNEASGRNEIAEGTKGCGKKYYQEALSTDEAGLYAETVNCECGATIWARAQLRAFQPVSA